MEPKGKDRVRENTSESINQQIDSKMMADLRNYANKNSEEITKRIHHLNKEWDIERWLETNASIIAFVGVLLGFFVNIYWLILPSIILIFLFQHAVQGWCPPVPIFRRLNVRTQKEIDREISVLKFIRGDFENINKNEIENILERIEK
jgi:hypothetical protein